MARKLRVEDPGALYHVMNRGDRREPIFQDDADRQRFIETLAEACAKTGWQVHACVLMPPAVSPEEVPQGVVIVKNCLNNSTIPAYPVQGVALRFTSFQVSS